MFGAEDERATESVAPTCAQATRAAIPFDSTQLSIGSPASNNLACFLTIRPPPLQGKWYRPFGILQQSAPAWLLYFQRLVSGANDVALDELEDLGRALLHTDTARRAQHGIDDREAALHAYCPHRAGLHADFALDAANLAGCEDL
jgi:hypothetical protein